MTLREFTVYYESYILQQWDYYSSLGTEIHNLSVLTGNINTSGQKSKGQKFTEWHPLRTTTNENQISKENFKDLRTIAKSSMQGR